MGDVCIVDPAAAWTVQPQAAQPGKHTPFSGYELPACVRATLVGGQLLSSADGAAHLEPAPGSVRACGRVLGLLWHVLQACGW